MRVLVLHSDVPADAPPEDQDTLIAAEAVAAALRMNDHAVALAAFAPDPEAMRTVLHAHAPEIVFNMVEGVFGQGELAPMAPALLEKLGIAYTGCGGAAMALAADKPLSKRILRSAGLPTPDWVEPPHWTGLEPDRRYIVKAATEDASVGLDDHAVVEGRAVPERARLSAARFGGRWFAEAYVEGREFNISVISGTRGPEALPIAEMRFERWPANKPRIVGYAAKWQEGADEYCGTVRDFAPLRVERNLHGGLKTLACKVWDLFGLRGWARIDVRTDESGSLWILEINPNPGIAPDSGFVAAAAERQWSYPEIIARLLEVAR